MKSTYFTPQTIKRKAREYMAATGHRDSDLGGFVPDRSALVLLDMQDYFLDSASHAFIPSAEAVIPGILKLIEAFHAAGRPVIFTRHLNTPENAGQMDKWWADVITENSPLSAINSAFVTPKGTIIEKSQYDAFHKTPLEDMLRRRGVTQVVIAGVMTHLCCETTARSAFVRGFEVFFLVDGTATYNEEFHKATILNLSHGFATLVLTDELLETMSHDSKR